MGSLSCLCGGCTSSATFGNLSTACMSSVAILSRVSGGFIKRLDRFRFYK